MDEYMSNSMIGTKALRGAALATMVAVLVAMAGCGSKEPATPAAAPPDVADATQPAAPADAAAAAQTLAPTATTWSPEAMEELLAPVALYPDVVLGQVLVSSTNPQEVLDAGNWLLQNQALQGNALDEAAKQVGFTPPIRGLLQSPEVVDMMCSQMGWTAELGQAFVNDQQGVMDAVQRLRAQAKDVGNLQSSEQLKVATETQGGHEVITVSPPNRRSSTCRNTTGRRLRSTAGNAARAGTRRAGRQGAQHRHTGDDGPPVIRRGHRRRERLRR